jgi:hypothetical protein
VFTAKHLLGLGRVDLLRQCVQCLGEIRDHVFAAAGPFEEDGDVVDLFGEAVAQLEVLGEPSLPLKRLLRLGLVVPEVGRGDLPFELR